MIHINLSTASIDGFLAGDLSISFDSSVLTYIDAGPGTLNPSFIVMANETSPGNLNLGLFGLTPVTGSGSVLILQFNVVGNPGLSTNLAFESAILNDGNILASKTNGSVSVNNSFAISGTATYYNQSRLVSGVEVDLNGSASFSTTTVASGFYELNNVPSDDYTSSPSKTGEDLAAISSLDASFVLQHSIGTIILDTNQQVAADVNKVNGISSVDAALILQKSVSAISLPFPGAGEDWSFVPSTYNYQPLIVNQTGQDFIAVLLGDVTGNWNSGTKKAASGDVTLTIPDLEGTKGQFETVPVEATVASGQYFSVDLQLSFDPTVISVDSVSTQQNGITAYYESAPGTVNISFASGVPITHHGTLLDVSFQLIGEAAEMSNIKIISARIDEGGVSASTTNGSLTISCTAAPVIIQNSFLYFGVVNGSMVLSPQISCVTPGYSFDWDIISGTGLLDTFATQTPTFMAHGEGKTYLKFIVTDNASYSIFKDIVVHVLDADFNDNGTIDEEDWEIILEAWNLNDTEVDVDHSGGLINILDLILTNGCR